MPPVRTVFTSDENDVIRAMQKMQAEMAKLVEENRKLRNESKQQGGEGVKVLGDQISSIKNMAASYLTVEAAIQAVMNIEEKRAKRQKEAALAQLSTADAQRVLMQNLGAVSDAKQSSVLSDIDKIAQRTNVPTAALYGAGAAAFSAKGNLDPRTALQALEMAARYSPGDAGGLGATAGGLLDVAALTESPNAAENLGLLIAVQGRSHIRDMPDIAKNLVPAAKSIKGYGGTAGEALSLPAAMTMVLADPSGAVSATGSMNLAAKLGEALPNLKSTRERVGYMQSHPKEAAEFLKNTSFESAIQQPAKQLLTNAHSEIATLYAENLRTMPSGSAAVRLAEGKVGSMNREELQDVAATHRAIQGARDRANLRHGKGYEGVLREDVPDFLSATSDYEDWMESTFGSGHFMGWGSGTPAQASLESLNQRKWQIERGFTSPSDLRRQTREPTAQERTDLEEVNRLIGIVERIANKLDPDKPMDVRVTNAPVPSPRSPVNSGLEE